MLIGRERQLAELADHVAALRPVVVVGEAGIGKTSLLREAAAASGLPVREGGGLATLAWMDHLALRRALGHPVGSGDAARVAADVLEEARRGWLIIDDVHWCDRATIDVLEQLGGRLPLLTGVRRNDYGAAEIVEELIASGFVALELESLTDDESALLVRSLRPALPPADVERVVGRAGGNPLLLRELSATGEPSASLRLSLGARLAKLDAAGLEAFQLLALAGRPLSRDIIGDAGVKSLVDQELVVADGSSCAVRHALLAEVAVSEIDEATQRRLHAILARALDDPGEAARHHHAAGERNLALAAALQASEGAIRPGERARHLALAATCSIGVEANALRLEAARALSEANEWAGLDATLALLESPDPEIRGWAALLRAKAAFAGGSGDRVPGLIDEGLAAVAGTETEIEALLRVEQCRVPIFIDVDFEEGIEVAIAAVAFAREAGIDDSRARYFLGSVLAKAGRPGWQEHLAAALSGARASGDLQTELAAANNVAAFESQFGSLARAAEVAIEAAARAHELGLTTWENRFRMEHVAHTWHSGAYSVALELIQRLDGASLDARAREDLIIARGISLADTGRLEEAFVAIQAALDQLAPDDFGRAPLLWPLAEIALISGDPSRALVLVDDFMDAQLNGIGDEPFALVTRAWARLELGQDPGEPAGPQPAPMIYAVTDETAAIRLMFRNDFLGAARVFAEAARLWEPYHRRGEIRCLWAEAEALRMGGEVDLAVERLQAVEARAAELGMVPMLGRIRRSLRAAGVRRAAGRGSSADALTAREREVLDLVAVGLTNDQIAARLGVTSRTIETQLSSAVRKLGATNRSHAAALATGELG